MLSDKSIKYFKENWYSFEQIKWIEEWMNQIEKWETITKKEIKTFIANELFSKFKINV